MRSSTSERPRSTTFALIGLARVVHPFPSSLDAIAAAGIALVAGGSPDVALRLALGMLGCQFAIGAANDFADAKADSVGNPHKPIPEGRLSRGAVACICLVAAAGGLTVAATVSWAVLILAGVGLADGLLYDLRLKATPLAWAPFAAGVGLLPLYAWVGARGSAPPALLGIVAAAALAGAALALANAYADLDRDVVSGVRSVAVFLGPKWTLRINAALHGIVQVIAAAMILAVAPNPAWVFAEVVGCVLVWLGLGLAALKQVRARGLVWEVQAVGVVVLGIAWLAGLVAADLLT
jgi:4-hydroxybenzoate polyprenyltransferase